MSSARMSSSAPWATTNWKPRSPILKNAARRSVRECHMDVMSLLKTVPAVIGIAGLLTYFMRARAPVSDQELVNVVQRVRNAFLLLGCAALIMLSAWLIFRPAPPDHDTVSPLANVSTTISNGLV